MLCCVVYRRNRPIRVQVLIKREAQDKEKEKRRKQKEKRIDPSTIPDYGRLHDAVVTAFFKF